MKYLNLIILTVLINACGTRNYRTAYIKNVGEKFALKLRGKGALHPAGLSDIGKTYEDSVIFIIPRDEGIIKGEELPHQEGTYFSTGTITISGSQLSVRLYYNDTDDKVIKPDVWNGDYNLKRIR